VALRRWRHDPGQALRTEFRRFAQALRAQDYDRVLDSQGLLKSAFITRMARGVRCGQDFRCAREAVAARFYDRTFFVPRGRHAVIRNRELTALALGLPLPEGEADYGIQAPAVPMALDLPARYMVCLHGASRESKLWPDEHWAVLTRVLAQRGIGVVLPWGSAEERVRAEVIAEATAQGRVLPRLDLKSLAGVLGGARAVVGLDSGLSHLAVALNRPTVALYTDTDPVLTGVAGQSGRAINLGGPGMMPTPDQVLLELARMKY
jgi:heptosyltransferase-1